MKITYKLLIAFGISVAVVAALYLLQEPPAKNGFNRGRATRPTLLNSIDLKFNSYFIKALNDKGILLSNYSTRRLFSCGYDLKGLQPVQNTFGNDKDINAYTLPAGFFKDRKDNFSVDGFSCYNKAAGRVIFTYYYRNQFICLDTNLKVLYTAKLIDTNSVAKIKVGEYEAGGKTIRTMAKPALTVNKESCSDGDRYYNHSALTADNEANSVFNKEEVIDVYSLSNGKYSHSIYLPRYKGENMSGFAVHEGLLIALYERHLVSYRLEKTE